MEKSELQAAIYAAFEDVPYPSDDNIGDPDGRDDAESVTEWLRGMDWRSLTSKTRLGRLALYFMVPQASHYYLPAYLIGALNRVDGADRGIILCFHPRNLDPRYPIARDRFLVIVSLLSPIQKQLLADTLEYTRNDTIVRWVKYCEKQQETGHAFQNQQIKDIRAEYDPIIEYWNTV